MTDRRLTGVRYRVVAVTDPGAGNELTITPTGAYAWLVRSLVTTLTTDVTVANRTVTIALDDQTDTYWRASAGSVQAASLALVYSAYPGADASPTVGDVRGIPIDSFGQVVRPGHLLTTITDNLQAGDAYSDTRLHVVEFETGRLAPAEPMPSMWIAAYDPLHIP